MVPARQRLKTRDRAILQPHDRLIEDGDFTGARWRGAIRFPASADRFFARAWQAYRRRCGRRRCAWNDTSPARRPLMISSVSWVCGSDSARPIEAVRKISRSLKAIGARMVLRMVFGEIGDPGRILFREQDQAELVAGQPRQRVLGASGSGSAAAPASAGWNRRPRADRIVDLLEAVEGRSPSASAAGRHALGEIGDRAQAVHEQFAVRQAGEVVMHGVMQQALFGILGFGGRRSGCRPRAETSPSEPTRAAL